MEWQTTSTILERLRDFDDRAAWKKLEQRFRRPLLRFARRFGLSTEEAEDTIQEILVAFAQAHRDHKYDPAQGRLSSWLFGIAYRQIANRRRKLAAQQKKKDARGGNSSFWREMPDEREVQKAWDSEWLKSSAEACMRQARVEVSEKTYRAFDLVVRQGRTPDEAAAELGMARNAVYVAKHRVLKRLEELMKQYEELNPGT